MREWLFDVGDDAASMRSCLNDWSEIVESYSARSLTFFSDKLPALSAAAEKFGARFLDSYLARIWKDSLPLHLSWYRKLGACPPMIARPRAYQAPSWSWASINESVQMYPPKRYSTQYMRYTLQILRYDIQLADPNALYGAVTSVSLTVNGRIKQIEPISKASLKEVRFRDEAIKVGGTLAPIRISLDALQDGLDLDGDKPTAIFALKIGRYCSDMNRVIGNEGLLLCKSQGPNEEIFYTRVGYFFTKQGGFDKLPTEDEASWRLRNFEHLTLFDDCELQTIVII